MRLTKVRRKALAEFYRWYAWQESNLCTRRRRPMLYPLSYRRIVKLDADSSQIYCIA